MNADYSPGDVCRRLLCLSLSMLYLCCPLASADPGHDHVSYQLFRGDLNADGDSHDYYFSSHRVYFKMGGIISIIDGPPTHALYWDPVTEQFSNPVAHSLPSTPTTSLDLTDQQIASLGLTHAVPNSEFDSLFDVDGNGYPDLFIPGVNDPLDSVVLLYSYNQVPAIARFSAQGVMALASAVLTLADYNGDSYVDLYIERLGGTSSSYYIAYGNAAGQFGDLQATAPYLVEAPPPPAAKPTVDNTLILDSANIGSTAGEFRVDESGAATYTIPIATAPGMAGVAPQLSLNYSSQTGNGLLGKGWSLGGLSSIGRCRQTLQHDGGAEPITWSDGDRFCLDGQRLIVTSGTYGANDSEYKTEIDSFVKVIAKGVTTNGHPDYFVVERKDGSTSYYGAASNSKHVGDTANPGTTTLTWSISRYTDSVGNAIDYLYTSDSDGHRISEIRYGFTTVVSDATMSAGTHHANIVFSYENRANTPQGTHVDNLTAFLSGYAFNTNVRLSGIEVRNDNAPIKQYTLNYKEVDATALVSLSRVESVTECVGTTCLTPTVFTWISPQEPVSDTVYYQFMGQQIPVTTVSSGYGFESTASSSITLSPEDNRIAVATQFADLNADGIQDIIWIERLYDSQLAVTSRHLKYALGNGSGFDAPSSRTLSNSAGNGGYFYKLHQIDYNADGRSDILVQSLNNLELYLAEPQGAHWGLSSTPIDLGFNPVSLAISDINADGLADLVYTTNVLMEAEPKVYVRYLEHTHQVPSSATFYAFADAEVLYTQADVDFSGITSNPSELGTFGWWLATGPIGDFNGDGRVDLLVGNTVTHHTGGHIPDVYAQLEPLVTTDNGLVNSTQFFPHILFGPGRNDALAVDLNNDGLSDLLYRDLPDSHWRIALSNGTGFETDKLVLSDTEAPREEDREQVQLLDYNHDGYVDLVWHDTVNNQLEGKLWEPQNNTFGTVFTIRSTNGNDQEGHYFTDINGDGNTDYVHMDSGTLKTYLSKGANQPRHVIAKITNGLGAQTDIVYGALSTGGHYERLTVDTTTTEQAFCITLPLPLGGGEHCGAYPLVTADKDQFYSTLNAADWALPAGSHTLGKDIDNDNQYDPVLELNGPVYVVHEASSSAPLVTDANAKSTLSYYYGEAKIQASGRGMLGFERIKTIDHQTNITTITTYRQDFPFIGHPLKTETFVPDGSEDGVLISSAENNWQLQGWNGDISNPPSAPYRPYIASSIERQYDLLDPTTLTSQVQTDTVYNNPYGNVDEITVTTTGDGETYVTETRNTYYPSQWEQEKGRLEKIEVTKKRTDTAGTLVASPTRTSTFTYYNQAAGGLLEKEIIEPDNSLYTLTTTYTYNPYGNKLTATQSGAGVDPRVTAWTYGTTGGDKRYLITTQNAYGQTVEEVLTRNAFGQPLTIKDIHGTITTFEYDAFGTAYLEYNDTGADSVTLKAAPNSDCPSGAVFMQHTTSQTGSASAVCYDTLARPVREITTGFDGTLIFQDTEYDNVGRVHKVSLPYVETNPPGANDYTVNGYDILGRITSVTLPDQTTTTTSYQGRLTTITNALQQTHKETSNAIGEVISVEDHNGGKILYTYYPNGLLHTTQTTGNDYANGISSANNPMITTLTYDLVGRKISMDDPDKGYWQYTDYSVFGELKEQIDAKGQKVTMNYDVMGRMIQRTDYHSTGSVTEITDWVYDTATNGNGLLISESTTYSGQSKHYFYDPFGRIDYLDTILGTDGSYTEQTTYDQYNRAFQHFDASGDAVQHHYNEHGYLDLITDAERHAGVQAPLYQVTAMNARRQVTSALLGNGYTTQHGYDPQTGRITSITTDLAGGLGEVQSITYTYDALGNVTTRHNTSGSKNLTEGFCYDELNRLTQVNQDGTPCGSTDQITYDSFGNIKTKDGVTYTYGSNAGPHAVTHADGVNYHYDANGNVIQDTDRSITYSSFDKPTLIQKGSDSVAFTYGSNRARFKRVDTTGGVTTTTLYIGNVEKVINADGTYTLKRYVTGNGLWLTHHASDGTQTGEERRYLLKDSLGSIDVILDEANVIDQALSFDAWGRRRGVESGGVTLWSSPLAMFLPSFDTSKTTRGYTGHEHVDSMGLIHMNGRIYDAKLGRFLQADPVIQAPTNTQNYNRYTYVLNNPLVYTDPSGFNFFKELFDDILGLSEIPVLNVVVQVGVCILSGPYCPVALGTYNAALTYGMTGDFGEALKVGVISGVSAYAFQQIGGYFEGVSIGNNPGAFGMHGPPVPGLVEFGGNWLTAGQVVAQIASHAMVGGIVASLQDQTFGHGFVSAGLTKGVMGGAGFDYSNRNASAVFGRTMVAAMVGGTTSKISGGKFANGAVTAAVAHLMNAEGEGKWVAQKTQTPFQKFLDKAKQFGNDLKNSAKENLTVKGGIEAAYGIGGTGQGTTNLNGEKGYEVTLNKGVMLNPVGSIGGEVYSSGEINGFFQALEFCAIGCISIETNYQDWSLSTSIGPAGGFQFQTGVKGEF